MSKLISSNYIQPTAQKALNGELGLTSGDIAKSLGVDHHKVKEKIKRNFDFYNDCSFFVTHMGDNYYTVNVATAKYLVASWKNHIGKGYFKHLLEYEKFVIEKLPKLEKELQALKRYVASTMKPKRVSEYHVSIPDVRIQMNLFGEADLIIYREKKLISELTCSEKLAWEVQHNAKILEGISKKQNELFTSGKVLPFVPSLPSAT